MSGARITFNDIGLCCRSDSLFGGVALPFKCYSGRKMLPKHKHIYIYIHVHIQILLIIVEEKYIDVSCIIGGQSCFQKYIYFWSDSFYDINLMLQSK